MSIKPKKPDGRSSDLTFSWFTRNYGSQWEQWRQFAEGWIKIQDAALGHKLSAISWFLESYLLHIPLCATELWRFFEADSGALPDLNAKIEETVSSDWKAQRQNYIVDLINWILQEHFTELDDNGNIRQFYANPFDKVKFQSDRHESVYNPLPYVYIKKLRKILCPNEHGCFQDWAWVRAQAGKGSKGLGDWFEVDQRLIDKEDPDCVWRKRIKGSGQNKETIYEMWSPVRGMLLFIKLHLPLRTYQVRMLDSGEADTWRYEKGNWVLNDKYDFTLGTERSPWRKGVFSRIVVPDIGNVMTGLYVNTNKTADQNKEDRERGYIIPWQNEVVLYWLEKLRDWQEKYNPIIEPTPCTSLHNKHFGKAKSQKQKQEMGEICFLFRDASAKGDDRFKPAHKCFLVGIWYKLLSELEHQVATRKETLADGSRLRFVHDYSEYIGESRTKTEFPLHSLRVSLITCYAMEGSVPAPVLSKLIAGHSRLMMTLYYTRITPATMTAAMKKAEEKIDSNQTKSLRVFLKDASLRQIKCKTVFQDEASIEAALANRNPVGWEHRHIGLCLVGGNTVRSDEASAVGGCWNGGALIQNAQRANGRVYGEVPHGPENCVRCRWFISDARYLHALHAHFNSISYKASQSAYLAVELEQQLNELEDEQYFAEEKGKPFTKQTELHTLARRYDKQIVEADECAKDLIACFQLISRIIRIEEERTGGDSRDKLVAVGSLQDIHQPLKFIETDSEMWQLAQICEDAEVYPDLADELRKSPAIEKRSRYLNRLLMRKGYTPILMQMDDKTQLIAGNAMLRAMAKQASPDNQIEGFRQVANYMEAEQYLSDAQLLNTGIKALEHKVQQPLIPLYELFNSPNKSHMELIYDEC